MPALVDASDTDGSTASESDMSAAQDKEGGEKSKNSSTLPVLETPPPRSQSGDTPRPLSVGLSGSSDPVLRSIVHGLSQLSQADRRTLLQEIYGAIPEFQSTPMSAAGSNGSSTRMETPSKQTLPVYICFYGYIFSTWKNTPFLTFLGYLRSVMRIKSMWFNFHGHEAHRELKVLLPAYLLKNCFGD